MTAYSIRPLNALVWRAMEAEALEAQRLDALKRGNRIRTSRARLKQELHDGRDPVQVLRRLPPYARTMKVSAFLAPIPGLGKSKISRLLNRLLIHGGTTLEDLSRRQRNELMDALQRKDWGQYANHPPRTD